MLLNDMKKVCPGYWYGGEYSFLIGRCPQISRDQGYMPGNPGKGYPENWDRECPTCFNKAEVKGDVEPVIVSYPEGSYSSWGINGQVVLGKRKMSPFLALGQYIRKSP